MSTANGRYLCHCRRYSPDAIFKLVLSDACVLSNLPIVCGCFVVAHLRVMPIICVISAMILDVNAVPLSVIMVVGKKECLVMISINALATFVAVASVSGYANRYRENASIAVRTFSYPPLGGRLGSKSICMASSGPRSHSGRLSNSGVMDAFGVRLSLAHARQPSTHFLTCFAMLG